MIILTNWVKKVICCCQYLVSYSVFVLVLKRYILFTFLVVVTLRLPRKTMFGSCLLPLCFIGVNV